MITGHVFIATSLDGYIARSNGEIDWLLAGDDASEDHGYDAFIQNIDGIIMGRGTYEKVAGFPSWPSTRPVVVLSRTLTPSAVPEKFRGNVRFLNLDPKEALDQLQREGWKKVYVDGGQIIQAFLREELIEDIVITTVPVLIGQGLALFGDLKQDIPLSLIESKAFPSGLVQAKYRVVRLGKI